MKQLGMRHLTGLIVCACVLIGALPRAAFAQPIVIGQSVPLSGRNADIGRDMRDGALAVFAQANASNALGRPVQFVSLDNANSAARAAENTAQLLGKQEAIALFGYSSATTSVDSLPLAANAKALFFAPFSGSLVLREHPNVYTVRASYMDEATKIVQSKRLMGAERTVVLYYDDEVGRSNYDAVVAAFTALGMAKPNGVATSRTGPLEAKTIGALSAGDPHYVLATTQYDTVADYLKATGGRKAPVAALSFVNPDELVDAVGDTGRGTVVAQVVPSPRAANQVSVQVIRECADALNALNGAKLNYTSLESCIAAKVLLVALKKAGRGVTRESLLKTMPTLGRVDLGGFAVNYAPDHRSGGNWVELTILARGNKFER